MRNRLESLRVFEIGRWGEELRDGPLREADREVHQILGFESLFIFQRIGSPFWSTGSLVRDVIKSNLRVGLDGGVL